MRRWRIIILIALVLPCGSADLAMSEGEASFGEPGEASAEEIVETFVLTPIRTVSFDVEVPAEVFGPTTNNTCTDWTGKMQGCYLPPYVLARNASPERPETLAVLERHLSAVLNVWKLGSWPFEGASIAFDLKQYASLEHVWLTMRLEIEERMGSCWLIGEEDSHKRVARATTQPSSKIRIEVFDGTRNAAGYPRKTAL